GGTSADRVLHRRGNRGNRRGRGEPRCVEPRPVRGFHGDGGDRDYPPTGEGVAHLPVERDRGPVASAVAGGGDPAGGHFPIPFPVPDSASRPSLVCGTPREGEVRTHGATRCPALGRHDLEYRDFRVLRSTERPDIRAAGPIPLVGGRTAGVCGTRRRPVLRP